MKNFGLLATGFVLGVAALLALSYALDDEDRPEF